MVRIVSGIKELEIKEQALGKKAGNLNELLCNFTPFQVKIQEK